MLSSSKSLIMLTKESQNKIDNLKKLYENYKSDRPLPDRNLDQFWATEETVIRRVLALGSIPDISQKKILFLGDDDLTSLAFCYLFEAKTVTVIDIDKRLIEFVNKIAKLEKLPIETFEYDLRNPLPKDRFKDYDIIFFDPPYTPEAIYTWFSRAIEATLGKGRNKRRKSPETLTTKTYMMCYGYSNRSTERGLKIQQIITSLGLIIQEKIRGFNQYFEAKSLGSSSDLYILQPTPLVNIKKLTIARSQFYTGQTKK